MFADEFKHGLWPLRACRRPLGSGPARMHQFVMRPRQKSIVDEEIFFDGELGIAPLEVARGVIDNPVPQRQVLCAGGRPNRVGLHEAEFADGAPEGGRLEQGTSDGITTQMVERDSHELRLWVARSGGSRG